MITDIREMQRVGIAAGREVFGDENMDNSAERIMRFGEEAIELMQAADMTETQVLQLVQYVFGRPKEPVIEKEYAGSFLTLLAAAGSHKVDLPEVFDTEVKRIIAKKDACRAKHDAKPKAVRA